MSVALGIGGWLLAVTAIGAAAVIRLRLARHAEAVARACHEVRGPLTAVGLGLELAGRFRQLPHSRLRAIELELGRAAVALDDLSGIQADRRRARLEPVEVGQLVASSVEAWRTVAAARGASIGFRGAPAPVWVFGERLRIAQAVGNLLANAIEHGGAGIEMRLRPGARTVRVEVRDDGPGLPVSIDRLLRRTGRRNRSNRGHGLKVASAVARSHGGRLAAEGSSPGARLVLELPTTGR